MARMKPHLRNRISRDRLDSLLRISEEGPSVKDYDPTAAIEQWYGQRNEGSDSEATLIRRNGRRNSRCRTHHADMPIFWIKSRQKELHNNVEKSSPTGTTRCLKNGDDNIFWQHWKDAYLWDQACNSCPLHEKLKEEHFQLTPSSRMRNSLAEDVLDKKMLYLMKAYNPAFHFDK
ncbi:Hypothetical predicted protein [Paramuricea clavata]|uniref:Uncharacterized protein n=1 Tax=Paramuricea clavata TaxID=317549 RepID=A0A6S7JGA5_PARCT|nr:Hypothetical predicted protein [Paramuricea clavata]